MLQKYGGRVGGGALAIAAVLYIWSLLDSPASEPLFLLLVILLLPLGIYLTARASAVADEAHYLFVRLNGEGDPGSLKRQAWVHAQLRRGRSLRIAVLLILISAIALFVANHVTGSSGCTLRASLPPWDCIKSTLDWKAHAERQGESSTYTTKAGDSLALIALTRDLAPVLFGSKNSAAVFDLTAESPLTQALAPEKVKEMTIEAVARRLVITPAEVASRFATTPLKEGQSLKIPTEPPYDPRQWFDWLLWTLIGVAAYLLIEIARNLRDVPKGEGDFLGETSWYWTQLATGPLIAFVILLLFTHIDVDLLTGDEAALEVNLHEYPMDLLIVPAFLLGFYSRVTRELLDQITRTVFRSAWRAANGTFQVRIKGQTDNEVSSTVMFETDPSTAVAWSATAGTIDAGGVYQPPPQVSRPTQVFVTAVAPSSGQAATREINVVKHRFNVATAAPDNKLPQGQPLQLDVQPPVPAPDDVNVQWDVVTPSQGGVTLAPANGNQTSVTAPATLVGKTVTIQATYAGLSKKIDLVVV